MIVNNNKTKQTHLLKSHNPSPLYLTFPIIKKSLSAHKGRKRFRGTTFISFYIILYTQNNIKRHSTDDNESNRLYLLNFQYKSSEATFYGIFPRNLPAKGSPLCKGMTIYSSSSSLITIYLFNCIKAFNICQGFINLTLLSVH